MNTEALHLRHSKSGIFVRCMLDALELLRNPRAWVFVLPQAAMSAALLAGLLQFHRSPGNLFWAPIVRTIAGEDALHYPRFFRELPLIFSVLEIVMIWALFPVVWAAFVHALPKMFSGSPPSVKESLHAGIGRALRVWGGVLPAAVIHIGALLFIGQLRTTDIAESPRILYFVQMVSFAVIALVQVLSAFVIAGIMLGNLSLPSAWVRSWDLMTRSFWTTSAFLLLPRLPEIPMRWFIARLPEFWGRVDPDGVGPLLAARVLITLAGTLVAIAATSRFYMHVCGVEDS